MKAKKTGKWVFPVILALILFLTYTAFFGIENYFGDNREIIFKGVNDIRWGIDIKGGVEAVYSPDVTDTEITDEMMDAAKSIIDVRLIDRNITDAEVFTDKNNNQIVVRFPWSADAKDFDADAAYEEIAALGETALLTFREGESQTGTLILEGKDVAKAYENIDPQTGANIVSLEFTADGKAKFAEATRKLVGSKISIWMDDTCISSPTVKTVINDGVCYIDGMESAEEAKDLANKINAGSLPFALNPENNKTQIISPTLGENAKTVMLYACIAAFAAVCVIMILLYRLPGVIACFSLLGQIAGMFACLSGYFASADSFTLTIPGIAGIILSIGVGVDANVIAAERIKEEFNNGKTIDGAINSGYKNSVSAIIDGNVTIVIVALVLMGAFGSTDSIVGKIFSPLMSLFGATITGSIYSFGYTLLLGVIFNLLLGVLCSKWMMKSISRYKWFRKPVFFGGAK